MGIRALMVGRVCAVCAAMVVALPGIFSATMLGRVCLGMVVVWIFSEACAGPASSNVFADRAGLALPPLPPVD